MRKGRLNGALFLWEYPVVRAQSRPHQPPDDPGAQQHHDAYQQSDGKARRRLSAHAFIDRVVFAITNVPRHRTPVVSGFPYRVLGQIHAADCMRTGVRRPV